MLSGVMHPHAVDILSDEHFAEDAEASIQARIPSATVHLYTIPEGRERWHPEDAVKEFWKRMDGADVTGPTGF